MRRKIIVICLICGALAACNGNKLKEREKQLQDSFASIQSAKDAEMETLFQQLNEIDASLGEVSQAYTDISQVANATNEVNKDAVSSIKTKISAIKSLIEAEKSKLAAVNASLSKQKRQNTQLKTFVTNLENRVKEQEQQLQTLNEELQKKNIKIEELTKNVADLKSETKNKDKKIMQIEDEKHAAYFTIGTKKELRAKNIVDKKGGFIGLGRADVLSNNADFASLTKIDTRNTQEIPLTGKGIKVVTPHPETSYSLEGDPKKPTSIRITNPDLFWKASKCLVIMVD